MKQYRNSFTTNSRRAISVSRSLHMHHHSSLSAKRTENCDRYKTTAKSMALQSEINIPFPGLRTSSVISVTRTYTQSSTSNGGTTTYAFAKEMRIKRHLKPDTDFSNLRSCTLDSPTHQRLFKP